MIIYDIKFKMENKNIAWYWNNFDKEILEYYSCNNNEELTLKKQEYISKFKHTLNTNNAFTSKEVKIEQKQKRYKNIEKQGKLQNLKESIRKNL